MGESEEMNFNRLRDNEDTTTQGTAKLHLLTDESFESYKFVIRD